jgi:hypothetical protein
MKISWASLIAWVILLSAIALAADHKPNFTGKWELNPEKSDLGGAPITKLIVQVEHRDPVLKYTVAGTAGGREFSEVETISTDGKPTTDSRGAQIKAHWEGATVVIESTGDQGKALEATRLTLSGGGKVMTREYERKSADDPQKRHEIYDRR